jgi:predicted transposase YdaD
VGQLFEEEKIQYGREIEKNVTKTNELKFSKILLHAGLSIEEISNAMTVLTADDVRKIAEKMYPKSDIRKADPK